MATTKAKKSNGKKTSAKPGKKKSGKKKPLAKGEISLSRGCFAWIPKKTKTKGASRAALVKAARWPAGSVITAKFIDGDPVVQNRVKAAALGWTAPGLARLRLVFVDAGPALIRISFQYSGSWSVIGTECQTIPPEEPTMNFGWLTRSSTTEDVRSVVLHEFGHALGLIHEHQNPKGGIKWNKPAVYAELSGPPNNWDKATIDFNMFQPFKKAETNYTKTDKDSIMMYPIPPEWTLDGFTVGENTKLSKTDKKFIKRQYP